VPAAEPDQVPRWVPVAALAVTVAGLAVAAYLTIEHFTSPALLACPETGMINCRKVTSSAQSAVFGIPVALLGLIFFVAMLPANLPAAWRLGHPAVRYGRLVFALTGVGFVCYLVYAELFILDAICLWCTAVHVLTVALFAIVALGTAATVDEG
jgi:uncharacterized membrane protein